MRTQIAILVFSALGSCAALAATTADFPTVVSYDFLNDGNVEVPGRLFTPSQATANPTLKYPLVVFLHGSGEIGTDNLAQINTNIDQLLAGAKANGFYLYAPQSSYTPDSGDDCWDQLFRLNEVSLLAGQVVRDHNIDPNKVYIVGISAGGGGAVYSISNFTNMYAACAGVSCTNFVTAANLVNKPIWFFASRTDPQVPVATSENNVNNIRLADPTIGSTLAFPLVGSQYYTFYASAKGTGTPEDGASYYSQRNLNYSEYPTGGHEVWPNAFTESTLYTWLLAQTQTNQATPLTQPATGEKLLFDFGPTITGTSSSQVWNSPGGTNGNALPMAGAGTGTGTERTIAPAVVFAYASTGHRTPVILSVTKTFNGVATGTVSSVYPTSVASEGWEQGSTSNANSIANPAEILLSGLTPSALYKFKIYGSDTSNFNNSPTRYTINGSSTIYSDLVTHNNTSNFADFDHIAADSTGRIRLEVAPSPSTTANAFFSNINALEVSPNTAQTYAAWETAYFGTDTVKGAATATPQHDGVSNIVKYFCDLDPTQPMRTQDQAALPAPDVVALNSVNYLTLTFRKSGNLSGLTVAFQTSTDLQTWTTVTPTVLGTSTDSTTQDTLIEEGVPTKNGAQLYARLMFTGYSAGASQTPAVRQSTLAQSVGVASTPTSSSAKTTPATSTAKVTLKQLPQVHLGATVNLRLR